MAQARVLGVSMVSVWGVITTPVTGGGCGRRGGDETSEKSFSSWNGRPQASRAPLPDNLLGGVDPPQRRWTCRADHLTASVARHGVALHPPLPPRPVGVRRCDSPAGVRCVNAARSRLVGTQLGEPCAGPMATTVGHSLAAAHNLADGTAPSVHGSSQVDSYNPLPYGPEDHCHPVVEGVGVTPRWGEYRLQPSS
jgi:hypothetical protein